MKIKLEKIIEQVGLYVEPYQLKHFCNNEELINIINVLQKNGNLNKKTFENLLIENQDTIDSEKLLLMIVYNYNQDISFAEKVLNDEKELYGNIGVRLDQKDLKERKDEINEKYLVQKKLLKKAKKLGKDIDKVIVFYNYDEKMDKFWLDVVDSKEYINGKERSNTKNLKRFNEIDNQLKKIGYMAGIEHIFQAINFSDFEEMCIDQDFGYLLKTQILDNMVVKDGIASSAELNKAREHDFDKYYNIYQKIDLTNSLETIKENVEKNIQYFDINKMLLLCAYRLEEAMDEGKLPLDTRATAEVIYNNIKDDKKEYIYRLYFKDGEKWTEKDVTYSAEKLKRFIGRFTKDNYLTGSNIQEKREKIKSGEICLFDTGRKENDIIFTDEQLEEVALLSNDNLAYVAIRLNWDKDKILEGIKERQQCSVELLDAFIKNKKFQPKDVKNLYIEGLVSLEQIETLKIMAGEIDWSNIVNSSELIEYYNQSIKKNATELDVQKYNKYAELYKYLKIENEEEKEVNETELMETLIGCYNQEENQQYTDMQEDFFGKGILSANALTVLNNEGDINNIILHLYMQGKMSLNQIKDLIGEEKLTFEFMEKLVSNEGLEKNKRLEILKQGLVDQEAIFTLFLSDYIDENDMLNLANENIIDKPKAESMIRNKNNPDNLLFEITISGNLKKINYDSGTNPTNDIDNIDSDRKNKIMIDPNQRLEFLELLGAKKVDKVRIPKDSPFYEYEFFALPNENGEFTNDSVVIAERFYEETEEHIQEKIQAEKQDSEEQNDKEKNYYIKYATDNATYFFRGRDIIALKDYTNKTDAINNEEIIFKVDHNLADDSKVGSWASGVLYAITKAMTSSNFREFSKAEQRQKLIDTLSKYYGHEKLMTILEKAEKIDRGNYNSEILDEYEDIR